MAKDGYYRMQRGWLNHEALDTEPYCRRAAWAWLIEHANFDTGRYLHHGKWLTIGRGQLVASIRYLADKWGWSMKRVRTFLRDLSAGGNEEGSDRAMIGLERGTGITIITICNYDKYQAPLKDGAREGHGRGTARAQQGHKEKELKERKKDNSPSESGAPVDLKAIVFGPVRQYLVNQTGRSDATVRSQLGRWIRDYGEAETISAVSAAQRAGAVEPIAYTNGALRNGRAVTDRNDWINQWVSGGDDDDRESETLRGTAGGQLF